MCDSVSLFVPSKTVLLISNPGWRIEKIAKLTLNGNSRVHVDPNMRDARLLRALAQRLTKKEHVNPPFPLTAAVVEDFEHAAVKALYTLADVDNVARSLSYTGSTDTIVGYLSVIITELNIVTPWKRNMLMSNECCGIPMFANSTSVQCKHCEKMMQLSINPRIVSSSPLSVLRFRPSLTLKCFFPLLSDRPHARRNRSNQRGQAHPLRLRVDTTPWSHPTATRTHRRTCTEVPRAAPALFAHHNGLCTLLAR